MKTNYESHLIVLVGEFYVFQGSNEVTMTTKRNVYLCKTCKPLLVWSFFLTRLHVLVAEIIGIIKNMYL